MAWPCHQYVFWWRITHMMHQVPQVYTIRIILRSRMTAQVCRNTSTLVLNFSHIRGLSFQLQDLATQASSFMDFI